MKRREMESLGDRFHGHGDTCDLEESEEERGGEPPQQAWGVFLGEKMV